MGRGKPSAIGDRTINRNGYAQIKTEEGWRAEHILIMEEHLGRRLEPGEYVMFKPDAPRSPAKLENLELRRRGDRRSSNRTRIAQIQARIEELQAELDILQAEEAANV